MKNTVVCGAWLLGLAFLPFAAFAGVLRAQQAAGEAAAADDATDNTAEAMPAGLARIAGVASLPWWAGDADGRAIDSFDARLLELGKVVVEEPELAGVATRVAEALIEIEVGSLLLQEHDDRVELDVVRDVFDGVRAVANDDDRLMAEVFGRVSGRLFADLAQKWLGMEILAAGRARLAGAWEEEIEPVARAGATQDGDDAPELVVALTRGQGPEGLRLVHGGDEDLTAVTLRIDSGLADPVGRAPLPGFVFVPSWRAGAAIVLSPWLVSRVLVDGRHPVVGAAIRVAAWGAGIANDGLHLELPLHAYHLQAVAREGLDVAFRPAMQGGDDHVTALRRAWPVADRDRAFEALEALVAGRPEEPLYALLLAEARGSLAVRIDARGSKRAFADFRRLTRGDAKLHDLALERSLGALGIALHGVGDDGICELAERHRARLSADHPEKFLALPDVDHLEKTIGNLEKFVREKETKRLPKAQKSVAAAEAKLRRLGAVVSRIKDPDTGKVDLVVSYENSERASEIARAKALLIRHEGEVRSIEAEIAEQRAELAVYRARLTELQRNRQR